jgi:hypothetical protein
MSSAPFRCWRSSRIAIEREDSGLPHESASKWPRVFEIPHAVVYLLIPANIAVYGLCLDHSSASAMPVDLLFRNGAMDSLAIERHQCWRLIAYAFCTRILFIRDQHAGALGRLFRKAYWTALLPYHLYLLPNSWRLRRQFQPFSQSSPSHFDWQTPASSCSQGPNLLQRWFPVVPFIAPERCFKSKSRSACPVRIWV